MSVIEIPLVLDLRSVDTSKLANALGIFREELLAACEDIGLHVSERVKRILEEKKIWYTGNLAASITWSVFEETASVIGVTVGTNMKYAKYQELGTVAHFVPFHMAKTLYDQALNDWGWVKPDMRTSEGRALKAKPAGAAVSKGPGGLSIVTGKHQTYLTKHPERLWLKPTPDSKPLWGVVVSGNKQPFLYPGWEESIPFAEKRLLDACDRAADRIAGGG